MSDLLQNTGAWGQAIAAVTMWERTAHELAAEVKRLTADVEDERQVAYKAINATRQLQEEVKWLTAERDAVVARAGVLRDVLEKIAAEARHEYATGASSLSAMIQQAEKTLSAIRADEIAKEGK